MKICSGYLSKRLFNSVASNHLITSTFALKPRITIIPPRFTSVLTVEFEMAIEPALKGLSKIAPYVSDAYKEAYNEDIEVKLLRLGLNADPMTVPPFRNTQFFIERRFEPSYNAKRSIYRGALRTNA